MTFYSTSANATVSDSNKRTRTKSTNLDTTIEIHSSRQMQESGRNHHTSLTERGHNHVFNNSSSAQNPTSSATNGSVRFANNVETIHYNTVSPASTAGNFEKNPNDTGKNKISKSKDKSAEAAQAYLREHTESLPQPLGPLCREIANKMLSLTNDIEQRKISTLKMNSEDPATIPCSINLKIVLKAPDRHREKEVYKKRSDEFEALLNTFKADATNLFKANAEEVVQTLKEERCAYLIDKAVTISGCIYKVQRRASPTNPANQTRYEMVTLAQHAVKKLIDEMDENMITYLQLSQNEIKSIFKEKVTDQTTTEAIGIGEDSLVAKQVIMNIHKEVDTLIQKLTVGMKNVIDEMKKDIDLVHDLTTFITSKKILHDTEMMANELEREEPINAREMNTLIKKLVEEGLSQKVKEITKRMAKNSGGGGDGRASTPGNNGPSAKSSENSRKQSKNKKTQSEKKANAKKKKDANKVKKTPKKKTEEKRKDIKFW